MVSDVIPHRPERTLGAVILVPEIRDAIAFAGMSGRVALSRISDIRPGIGLSRRGHQVVLPISLLPVHFQMPFGTRVVLSGVLAEGHLLTEEARRIQASASRIGLAGEPLITVLPDMSAAFAYGRAAPGYVVRGPGDATEIGIRLTAGDHVILTPIDLPPRISFDVNLRYQIMAGCPEDTEDRLRATFGRPERIRSGSADLLAEIAASPSSFSL